MVRCISGATFACLYMAGFASLRRNSMQILSWVANLIEGCVCMALLPVVLLHMQP